jgi:hypothetical protein
MMAGIHLGGRHLEPRRAYVPFFLLLEDYKYNYIYNNMLPFMFRQGKKETCNVSGMKHAAPVILAFWSE